MRRLQSPEHGIYLHLPWCASICPYCAFYKRVEAQPDYESWLRGIRRDWEHWKDQFPGRTHSIYFGGGTPSLAPARVIGDAIASLPHDDDTEVTVEVNPGSIDRQGLMRLREQGVNRLSLGIQSLQPEVARVLARGHNVRQAAQLLGEVQDLGLRTWSADLIFAVPGQNLSMLDRDLDVLLAANTPHISLYGLSIEPGTAFQTMQQRGQLRLPDEDVWAELFDRIRERLNRVGMEHYEISNFARKGHRSVHNSSTWRGGHYAGLGPSAHGFAPDGDRWMNPADVENWLENPPPLAERPSPASAAVDYLLSTLRHIEGSDLNELYAQTGLRPTESTVQTLIDGGMLKQEGPMLRLRPAGVALADGIVQKLCESLAGIP